MPTPLPREPMPAEQGILLAEFARTCKAAARAVSLYPGAHPAIGVSLSRVVAATSRLARHGAISFEVGRDILALDGRTPVRPDPAVGELASLLHDRLIGALIVHQDADADDWRAFFLLLARTPDEVLAGGGIASGWARSGRSHFEIREIDYAEVLRERGGGEEAERDRLVAYVLRGDTTALDDGALTSLLEALSDVTRFAELLERVQREADADGTKIDARIAALLHLIEVAVNAARARGDAEGEQALQTVASSCASLAPEMMLALLERRQSENAEEAGIATSVVDRMTDQTIASFMSRSVVSERGATGRLAQALETLVPSLEHRGRVVELAKAETFMSELGSEGGFEQLWQDVANSVMSSSLAQYTDEPFVSEQYGRELSSARRQAVEVERVSDDPPERVQAWVATVSEFSVQQLDLEMLLDLMRIEADLSNWEPVAAIAAATAEHRTLGGDTASAQALVDALVNESGANGRAALRVAASRLVERLGAGPLARHVGVHLRTVEEKDVEGFARLCRTIGSGMVRPLADALTSEANAVAVRRLGALLLSFGPAGRRSVEQLKNASNPAVRRTAVTILSGAGGQDALSELASMLDDADPDVQRETVRAIARLGTDNAYAVLHRLLLASDTPREAALRELLTLRDDTAAPLFCFLLARSQPRGRLATVHLSMIEALATMTPRPDSARTLQQVLLRGDWWAPLRTARLRQAAAHSLGRLGTPEALAALESAAASGSRSVRKAARTHVALLKREKART